MAWKVGVVTLDESNESDLEMFRKTRIRTEPLDLSLPTHMVSMWMKPVTKLPKAKFSPLTVPRNC